MLKNLLVIFFLKNVFSMQPKEEQQDPNLNEFSNSYRSSPRSTGAERFSPLKFYQKFRYILQNEKSTIGLTLLPLLGNLFYRQFTHTKNLPLLKIFNLFSLGLPVIGLFGLYLQNEFQIKKLENDNPNATSSFAALTIQNLLENPWHILTVPMYKRLRLINKLDHASGAKILQNIDTYKSIEILNQMCQETLHNHNQQSNIWNLILRCDDSFVEKIFTLMTPKQISDILTAGITDDDDFLYDSGAKHLTLNLIDDDRKKQSILESIGHTHPNLKRRIISQGA